MKPRRAAKLGGIPVSVTRNTMMKVMQPPQANIYGYVHGGEIMKLVDEAAFVSAMRLARCNVVTAGVDQQNFLHPVRIGDVLILKSQVNYVGKTSMEVGVLVEAEDLKAGRVHKVGSAYFTMVALDDLGRPAPVPRLIVETAQDRARSARAKARRQARLDFITKHRS